MSDFLSLIHADRAAIYYRRLGKQMPKIRGDLDRAAAASAALRAGLRHATVYRFDRPASRFAGGFSVDILADEGTRLPSMIETVIATMPPQGVFIEYQLDAMLAAIGAHDSARLFAPSDPRDHRTAAFLFRPARGQVRAAMWVEENIEGQPVAALEPLTVVLGGASDIPMPDAAVPYYPNMTALALAATTRVPAAEGIIGLRANADFHLMAGLESQAGAFPFIRDRAGMARRALALLSLVLDPPTRIGISAPTLETHRVPRTAGRHRHSVRAVTLHLVEPGTSHTGRVVGGSAKALHDVRGHWRNLPPQNPCLGHMWSPTAWEAGPQGDSHVTRNVCLACGSRRTFIREHSRGDESLGRVVRSGVNVTL